jgi:hypothetical protein
MKMWVITGCLFLCLANAGAQDADTDTTHAGYVPVISGGLGYIYNVNGGVPSLEPQIDPLLLLPLGSHVLVESRTNFTGFFQRRDGTSGDYTGQIFKGVAFAQVDWLANTHVTAVAGRYLLPFGLYNERLSPLWITNLQDQPIATAIGTSTGGNGGSGDGFMLRGVATQNNNLSVQYSAYFSAHSNTNQLQAERVAGMDGSVYFTNQRIELGGSYQRFLEGHQINSWSSYLSWQPQRAPLDLKAEYDRTFNGDGYWIEGAYMLSQVPAANSFFKNVQLVGRAQQFFTLNGGGNGVPGENQQRMDLGLNYYIRDDWRLVSSYGRQFTATGDANIWHVGFTYRLLWPLWPGRK